MTPPTPSTYGDYLFSQGLAPRTIRALTGMYRRLLEANSIHESGFYWFLQNDSSVAKQNRAKETFSKEEIQAILSLDGRKDYSDFLLILAYTGVRPGELFNLRQEDINENERLLTIKATKTMTDRVLPVPELVIETLRGYQDINGFFHFTDQALRDELRRRCKLLEILYRPPYSFRHSYITRMIDGGSNFFAVKQLAGHRQTKTTENYYHGSLTALKQAVSNDSLSDVSLKEKMTELVKLAREILQAEDVQGSITELKNGFKIELSTEEKKKKNKMSFTV